MLNLNAMFGTAYEVFGNTEPQMSENDFEKMKLEIEVGCAEAACESMQLNFAQVSLDRAFNMYNHVKNYGIDRTFLSLFNSNGELDNAIGCSFPSCESVDFNGSPYSNMSRTFIAAMEDENEGFFAKIWAFIKKCWNAIVNFIKGAWDKFMSLFKKKDGDVDAQLNELDKVQSLAGSITVKMPEPMDKQAADQAINELKESASTAVEGAKQGIFGKVWGKIKDFATRKNAAEYKKLKVTLKTVDINNVGDLKNAVRELRKASSDFKPTAIQLNQVLSQIESVKATMGGDMPAGLTAELGGLRQSADQLEAAENADKDRVQKLSAFGRFVNWITKDSKETSEMIMKHRIAIWEAAAELSKKIKAAAKSNKEEADRNAKAANSTYTTAINSGTEKEQDAAEANNIAAQKAAKRAGQRKNAADSLNINDPY
jgi:hypothetical protein